MRLCYPLRVYNKATVLAHFGSVLPSVSYLVRYALNMSLHLDNGMVGGICEDVIKKTC